MTNDSSDPEQYRPGSVLSFNDLCEFVGRKRPTAVSKWLQGKGILYFLDANGRPCTTAQAIHEALLRGRRTVPNFSWLLDEKGSSKKKRPAE